MQRHEAADQLLTDYLEASDRYAEAVDELRAFEGKGHQRFLIVHEHVRRLALDVEAALSAMTKEQGDLKPSG